MRKFGLVFGLTVLTTSILIQTVQACSPLDEVPLRKSFRKAEAVFLAEVAKITALTNVDYEKSLVDGDISFRIIESWKGKYRDQTVLSGNVGWNCGCAGPGEFKIGTQYIVFVDKSSNANFCDATIAELAAGKKIVGRLDSFWFRTWAGIYPF